MLMKSLAEGLWHTQTEFLSKEVLMIVTARQRNAQMIKVLGAYTLQSSRSLYTSISAKRLLYTGSAFLGKYASIKAVDLIQWKKSNFWNFYLRN